MHRRTRRRDGRDGWDERDGGPKGRRLNGCEAAVKIRVVGRDAPSRRIRAPVLASRRGTETKGIGKGGFFFTVGRYTAAGVKGVSAIFENGTAKIQSGSATFKFGTATHLAQFLRALSYLSPCRVSARGGNAQGDF